LPPGAIQNGPAGAGEEKNIRPKKVSSPHGKNRCPMGAKNPRAEPSSKDLSATVNS